MKINFQEPGLPTAGTLVVGAFSDRKLSPAATEIDRKTAGALTRAMEASRFAGKKDQTLAILAPAGLDLSGVLLVGLGDSAKLDEMGAQTLGGATLAALNGAGATEATVWIDGVEALDAETLAANLAYGARLRSYRFDKYRTKEKEDAKPSLKKLRVAAPDAAKAKKRFSRLDKVADGVFLTRDLASEPANVIYPESMAEECRKLAELGVEVEVLDEKKMRKLGMNALLGVGQGSERESQLVVMQWKGGAGDDAPLVFVGKGVTFDTGGISIKPAQSMEDMKWDMAGAGAVVGAMKAIAGRKAKANVVGVVGLVENMPSGTAQRPGDVVKTMSGQTVEVINTDAEGRLVLADALWYAKDRFKPKAMVDLATLTGAMIIALGHEHAGVFSNDDDLAGRLVGAGKEVGEALWRMPLGDVYDKDINCDVADMKNVGAGRAAGSITAAQFLQRFVDGASWAHIDIAGVAWTTKDRPLAAKGATGFGVRLLDRLVADYEEAASK